MKNSKRSFILIEVILGVTVIILASVMLRGRNKNDRHKVSVIVQNSDDNQWAAFKYGLRMAAADQDIEMFIVSTEGGLTLEEEEQLIEYEIDNGAEAIIIQPVPGADTESLLKKIEKKIPVMLVEDTAGGDGESSGLPITQPDNYALGKAMAMEILTDFAGNVNGKSLGIVSERADSPAAISRETGFRDGLDGMGVEICWSVADSFEKTGEASLEAQPKVDIVIALDDNSLSVAGKASAAHDLHGALVYGFGNSTEGIYYLDTGVAECLVVPDEFNVGYQSLTEIAGKMGHHFHTVEDQTVSHTVIRRGELFSRENQEIIFTMSQ